MHTLATTQPRLAGAFTSLCATLLLAATTVAQDECTLAFPIVDGGNGPFTNVGATNSSPAWPCGAGANDVWFAYTAIATGVTTVTTCCANFDTVLQVFDGHCGALISLGCNDDSCGLQSSVTFGATMGNNYYIRVGGFAGATGQFPLLVNYTPSGTIVLDSAGACGAMTINVSGNPNIGGSVTSTLANVPMGSLPFVGYDFIPWIPAQPCMNCFLGHNWTYPFLLTSHTLSFPCHPGFIGLTFFVQGTAFGFGTTGCVWPPLDMTDTYAVTIG